MVKSFKIVSSAGLDMGVFEAATALEAVAAMQRDAGYRAHVVDGELVTDAPGDSGDLLVSEVDAG